MRASLDGFEAVASWPRRRYNRKYEVSKPYLCPLFCNKTKLSCRHCRNRLLCFLDDHSGFGSRFQGSCALRCLGHRRVGKNGRFDATPRRAWNKDSAEIVGKIGLDHFRYCTRHSHIRTSGLGCGSACSARAGDCSRRDYHSSASFWHRSFSSPSFSGVSAFDRGRDTGVGRDYRFGARLQSPNHGAAHGIVIVGLCRRGRSFFSAKATPKSAGLNPRHDSHVPRLIVSATKIGHR